MMGRRICKGRDDMQRWMIWGLPIVTALSYAVLVLILAPRLGAETGGLMPFDLRLMGYDHAAAEAYLTAMTPAGQALYLGWIRLNDTIFPILFALTLCLPLRRWDWPWTIPALLYGLADLAENWAVARLIRTGPQVDDGSVWLASNITQAKFGFVTVAIGIAIAGIVSILRRRWRR